MFHQHPSALNNTVDTKVVHEDCIISFNVIKMYNIRLVQKFSLVGLSNDLKSFSNQSNDSETFWTEKFIRVGWENSHIFKTV